jgi:hypothetical protein
MFKFKKEVNDHGNHHGISERPKTSSGMYNKYSNNNINLTEECQPSNN